MEWTQNLMGEVGHFKFLKEHREETYSSRDELKIYFQDEWEKYYMPMKRVV
jgi:hypothetical protein